MKKITLLLFVFSFIFLSTFQQCFSQFNPEQQKELDSLGSVLNNPNSHDTSIARTYMVLSEMLYASNNDTLMPLCEKARAICETGLNNNPSETIKSSFLYSLSHAYTNLGFINNRLGKVDLAISYDHKALKIQKEIKDSVGIANTYNNMGFIFYQQGNIPKALDYFHLSLKMKEALNDKKGLSHSFNNIGAIHRDQGNDSLSMVYHKKALKLRKAVGDKRGVANSYNNIAILIKDHAHAIDYHRKALEIRIEINNEPGIASTYDNMGNAYFKLGQTDKAIEHFKKSLEVSERISYKREITTSKHLLATAYLKKGELLKAEKYGKEALEVAQEIGSVLKIKDGANVLSEIYGRLGKGMEGLKMHKLYTNMKDSINNERTLKASVQQETKYEYEKKKSLDDAEHDKAIAIEQEEKAKQKVISIAVGVGLFLVVVFLAFVFNRLRVTKRQKLVIEEQKKEVEEQKHQVEEAHQEITDSINYAERIQRSFLATDDVLNENLNDYFVFFQPKEAVSGDFYWAGKLANGNFAMVNADSTGHGVPGAIMSILNISSIERAVEKGLSEPSEIFNDTRKTIIERLKKDGSEDGGKDGMDASILCFDFENNKFKSTAANNPIWVIRNKEVIQLKPDKMPVGKHDNDATSFTQEEFLLEKGDQVYTLTDGFQDQFGGPKGKKFMIKKMREYVLSVSDLPMKEQYEKISKTFNDWMGGLEQIDDVCVIGVKI